jgi:hypothetical protein
MTHTPPTTAMLLRILRTIGVFPSGTFPAAANARGGIATGEGAKALLTSPTGVGRRPQVEARPWRPHVAAELAALTVIEGCVNGTVAAVVAAEEAERATDPADQTLLQALAADEASHVELAWHTVAWALQTGDQAVRRAVDDAFRRSEARWSTAYAWDRSPPLDARDGDDETVQHRAMQGHARATLTDRRALVERALAEVVTPSARALLAKDNARRLAEEAA